MATKLQKAQVEVKRLWNLMCEWDGIEPTAQFVAFNANNPFTLDYNKAVHTYMRLRGRANLAQLRNLYSPSQWKAAVR